MKQKREAIITNPDGEIHKIARKKLDETTFPSGVKNPLGVSILEDELCVILKIIGHGLDGNSTGVRNYAEFLADKLEKSGNEKVAKSIRKRLEPNQRIVKITDPGWEK